MFNFVTRYLGFLKFVPGLALVFDNWLKVYTLLTMPELLDWLDDIEAETYKWPGVKMCNHKYGGIQFNYQNKEIGHIHSNGLLDMLLSRSVKQHLMHEGRIRHHHSFKNTGWISFYICNKQDADYALELLEAVYCKLSGISNSTCRKLESNEGILLDSD